jgi:hypothetical protein
MAVAIAELSELGDELIEIRQIIRREMQKKAPNRATIRVCIDLIREIRGKLFETPERPESLQAILDLEAAAPAELLAEPASCHGQ